MSDKHIFVTRAQMLRLINSGRAAIEHRLVRAVVLPIDRRNSDAEVDKIKALLHKYNEVMAVYEKPIQMPSASNDEDGSKG